MINFRRRGCASTRQSRLLLKINPPGKCRLGARRQMEIEIVLAKLSLLFKVAVPPLLQLPATPTENK
jgi:hypothetical protein